jgi:hypothetical protein
MASYLTGTNGQGGTHHPSRHACPQNRPPSDRHVQRRILKQVSESRALVRGLTIDFGRLEPPSRHLVLKENIEFSV